MGKGWFRILLMVSAIAIAASAIDAQVPVRTTWIDLPTPGLPDQELGNRLIDDIEILDVLVGETDQFMRV